MAEVYAALIRKGKKSFDDVPEKLKDAVKALLGGEFFERDEPEA